MGFLKGEESSFSDRHHEKINLLCRDGMLMGSTKQQIDSPGGKHFLRVHTLPHTTVAVKWKQEKTWTAEKYH